MRTIPALVISLALVARAQAAQPSDLLVVVDAAAPATELPAWNKVVARFAPGTPVPKAEALAPLLGNLIGVPQLAGVDWSRPLHAALVDPQGHPKPLVLVVPVKDAAALAASVKPAQLEVHVAGKVAVIGDTAILKRAEQSILTATKNAPAHGLHVTAFARAIDAAYGAQIAATVQILSAQAPPERATAGKAAKLLVDLIKETERLTIDVEAADATPVVTLALEARPESPMAALFAAQKPSDFGLLAKLAPTDAPVLMAGTLDMKPATAWLADLVGGLFQQQAGIKQLMEESSRLFAGDLAVAETPNPTATQVTYLMRVSDVPRMLQLLPKWNETAATGNLFGVKISTRGLPKTRYAGLSVIQSEQHSDFSHAKFPQPGPANRVLRTASTGWADLMAVSLGSDALGPLRKLVDSARGGKPGLVLDAPAQASLERARSAGDSVWIRIDADHVLPGTGKPTGSVAFVTLGFQPSSLRLRLAVDQAAAASR